MKTSLEHLKLSDHGLTELNAQEAAQINGGGIIDGMWWGFWGGVLSIADTLLGGNSIVQDLIVAVVGRPPGRP